MRRGRYELAVTEKQARSVIAKLRKGKSSVRTEAIRLGVYHATLRKRLRAVLGSKQYDVLMGSAVKKRGPRPRLTSTVLRIDRAMTTLPSYVEDPPLCCQRCGTTAKAGTNGNGRGILWCSCGWSAFIPRVPALVLTGTHGPKAEG